MNVDTEAGIYALVGVIIGFAISLMIDEILYQRKGRK